MYKFILLSISFFYFSQSVYCAKFLLVFPIFSPSHNFLGHRLMEGLTDHGHDVTYVSAFKSNYQPKNGTLQTIVLDDIRKMGEAIRSGLLQYHNESPFQSQAPTNQIANTLFEMTINHKDVQNLLKSNKTFDVVITEQFLMEGLKYLATHFQAHLVVFSTFGANTWFNSLVGNPPAIAYTSELQVTNSYKSFGDRLYNFVLHYYIRANIEFVLHKQQEELLKKYFPTAPSLEDIIYNTSLVLMNSHISTNQAVPKVPCMIDIGGFHVKPPKKLPNDLQKFLDEANEGVIYFSLGSNLRSSELSDEKRNALLNVFAKRKEKILWKWETDDLPGKPPNVFLKKWFPQQDILAHPNVKLFITHCGLLSTTETVYHSVPILAIPIFADQKLNAAHAERQGFGISIEYANLNEETFGKQLNEILSNPKYQDNVNRISRIFHDRPEKPIDTAVYWLEYVIRHNGAKHLRVAALELTWYQNYLLDVLAFIFIVIILSNYTIYIIVKNLYRKFYKKTKQKLH